jgi:antirestriction protein ArdC
MATTTVYEIVTQKVLAALAKGTVPWQKPWDASTVRPCNAETGRPYSGGNMFLLSMLPYAVPAFLTFNQIKKAGARIKEGQEKAHFPVFYWNWVEKVDDKGNKTRFPMLRYFLVWNVEQIEDYTLPERLTAGAKREHSPIESAESIVKGFINAPELVIANTDRACYHPATDKVMVPMLSQYAVPEAYYSTLFHELAHSTGHGSRLNRKEVTDPITFGSHDYSLEELVAELTAAFLCAESGINNTVENSAAYIGHWHAKLSNDPKLFWTAAGRAQKAADYILGRGKGTDEEAASE